jgi:hypothetical protein
MEQGRTAVRARSMRRSARRCGLAGGRGRIDWVPCGKEPPPWIAPGADVPSPTTPRAARHAARRA